MLQDLNALLRDLHRRRVGLPLRRNRVLSRVVYNADASRLRDQLQHLQTAVRHVHRVLYRAVLRVMWLPVQRVQKVERPFSAQAKL